MSIRICILYSYYPTLRSRRCDQVGFASPLCSIITQAILVIRTVSPFIVSHAHKGRVQYCCSCSNVYVFSQSQVVSAIRGLLYEAEVWFHVKMCRAQTFGEYIWFGCNCKTFHVCCMYTVVGGYSRGTSECSSCYIYIYKKLDGWSSYLYVAIDVVIVRRHGFFLFSCVGVTQLALSVWVCRHGGCQPRALQFVLCHSYFCSNIHSHKSIMCYLVMGLHINHSWAQTADRVELSKL